MENIVRKKASFETVWHLCFWAVFASQIILFRSTQYLDASDVLGYMLHMAVYVSVFYAFTFLILPRYYKQPWKVVLIYLAVLCFCLQIHYLYHDMTDPAEGVNHHRLGTNPNVVICVTLFILLALSHFNITKISNKERKQRITMQLATETELEKLKSQLHPHMVFNSLNNIYALVSINPERAQESILHLSAILRYLIKDRKVKDQQRMVEISKEAKFVRDLISLYKLKLTNTTKVIYNEDIDEHPNAPCLVLIFMNLVENAFTYGASTAAETTIEINLTAKSDTEIYFSTRNRILNVHTAQLGNGTGIENVRRRLELLYGEDAQFSVRQEGGDFVTEMHLLYTEHNYYMRNKHFNKTEERMEVEFV